MRAWLVCGLLVVVSPAGAAPPVTPARPTLGQKARDVWKRTPRAVKAIGVAGAGAALTAIGAQHFGLDPQMALEQAKTVLTTVPPAVAASVGAAAAGAATTGVLYWRGRRAVAAFERSPAAQQLQRIDALAKGGAGEDPVRLATEIRRGADALAGEVAQAMTKHEPTVGGMKLPDAYRQLAYAGLAEARAVLAAHRLATGAQGRPGATPGEWQNALGQLESQALTSGREGTLALKLDDLAHELTTQAATYKRIEGQIASFTKATPLAFAGKMKAQSRLATDELAAFKEKEIAPEEALHKKLTVAMRARVGKRLYQADSQFHTRSDRRDRLAALADGPLGDAVSTARAVASDLASVVSNRTAEQLNLSMAAASTSVPVQKTRLNAKGEQEPYTDYEDHSGIYRVLAATAAASAASSASSARSGMDKLRTQVGALRGNPTVAQEGLTLFLPSAVGRGPQGGLGQGLVDLFAPAFLGLITSVMSDASAAQSRFSPVLSEMEKVHGEVQSRRQGESNFLDGQIDRALDGDMALARAGK
jgi:hypothetical protein